MNENIDLVKILKNCPRGTKLYSSVHGEVSFLCINNEFSFHPIEVLLNDGMSKCYSADGKYNKTYNGECILFPSKEQRDWSKFTTPWCKKERFDPKTLQPFDKVLVRSLRTAKWRCEHFSYFKEGDDHPYMASTSYAFCVPYNDETKHLVGTKEEAPEYYRYWGD